MFLALLVPVITQAAKHAEYTAETWKAWKQANDRVLADVMKSYLSVVDHALVRPGGTIYLPVGGMRNQIRWRTEAPGKPMVILAASDAQLNVSVTSTGERLDLLDGHSPWATPDGMLVTAEKVSGGVNLVLRDPQKEGFKGFKELSYFPFNPRAVARASLDPLTRPMPATLGTTQDKPRQAWLIGTIDFTLEGRKFALKAYSLEAQPSYRHLFVPFLDATNGVETYAGGRYVEVDLEDSGNGMIDFNRAYNPYCARNHEFNCIKVSGRPLEMRIEAGEKSPVQR